MSPRLAIVLFSTAICSPAFAELPKPNIVLMMADDMGMGDTSAYQAQTKNDGAVQLHTPAMDRLARMGVRFTDAHTPSTRCTTTRYGLLTGRYCFRSRLKYWVLFGVQGDPLIERDRPTIASLLKDNGYRTAIVGKWHVGLRYRNADGEPANAWADADLTKPMFDGPLDHGFEQAWITSRSHGTSGPGGKKKNSPKQNAGPGHIHGREIVGATGNGKQLVAKGEHAYVLTKLGSRHSNHAIEFFEQHVADAERAKQPFFLYYPANSNHGPYTPDSDIDGKPVAGAGRSVAGGMLSRREDYIYENDVALARMMKWLESHDDPRRPGHKLADNTVVIFTSDNGAEKDANVATGPYRSNKGSCYEGGHRVPFLVTWPAGRVGDGNADTPGAVADAPIVLTDLFATFAEIVGADLPDLRAGEKGGEDSFSLLSAWRGKGGPSRPFFVNDHKQGKDPAMLVLRSDSPQISGKIHWGKWKLFFDSQLIRRGQASPVELYDLESDPEEQNNLIAQPGRKPLIAHLSRVALKMRRCGGQRLAGYADAQSIMLDWRADARAIPNSWQKHVRAAEQLTAAATSAGSQTLSLPEANITIRCQPAGKFHLNARGLGIAGGEFGQVEADETLIIQFDRDVIVESVGLVAGNGVCGGSYQVAGGERMPVYCVDADNDSRDQMGQVSDLGVLKAGQTLRISGTPVFASEPAGRWRLESLTFRPLK